MMSLINMLVNKKMPPEKAFFLRLIHNRDVSILFQPISDLTNGDVFGIEALCRGPINTKYYDPVALLTSGEDVGLLYPLESMIRENSIRKFSGLGLSSKLFLNLTPKIVNEPGFAKGQTRRLVKHLGIQPSQVVFEITERSSIKDFTSFRKALEHYREQGFLVAVDDAGAGYSSLQAIAELHP
ncbi:MAG TPA: EAL domain-containing protein, partial [Desulfobacteria bacterium]|nr:EAL domain-containing protein [Desulfobacteria bacterium]